MNTLNFDNKAKSIKFDDYNLWVEFTDGRLLAVPLVYFPRLENASSEQRTNYVLSGGGTGIHWDDLDEDISVPHLLSSRSLQKAV